MKLGILIQARMSSERLPGKVLMKFGKGTLLDFIYRRCSLCEEADEVIVLTSTNSADDVIADHCENNDFRVARGDLKNVLKRFTDTVISCDFDAIVRVCADSPFVDYEMIDEMLKIFRSQKFDYIGFQNETIIPGIDSEIIGRETLLSQLSVNLNESHEEHVTLYIKENLNQFRCFFVSSIFGDSIFRKIRLTVDFDKDLEFCKKVWGKLSSRGDESFSMEDLKDELIKLDVS